MKKMEDEHGVKKEYSTDASSDSFYEVPVDMDYGSKKSEGGSCQETPNPTNNQGTSAVGFTMDSSSALVASAFGTQLQELVMRALFQSTGALIGPPPSVLGTAQGGSTGGTLISGEGVSPSSMWKESTFNKMESRCQRKAKMKRTSAGEDSNSQQDFPVPENESPQQKSLRTRRLNRFCEKRAKELTNNRKAENKQPYVLHIDGMGTTKGVHRHQWRAAVRGQCGRLDPSKDNLQHHPEQVVDNIWHALEREWEFEGFKHRAREVFEKSATKCMRNRKFHLKKKSQRSSKTTKPDNVSGVHWSNIVDMKSKSAKQSPFSTSMQTTPKGKEKIETDEEDDPNSFFISDESDGNMRMCSPDIQSGGDSVLPENDAEDVDAIIRSLQCELTRLQNSRKSGFSGKECICKEEPNTSHAIAVLAESAEVVDGMKENLKPSNTNIEVKVEMSLQKMTDDVEPGSRPKESRPAVPSDALREICQKESADVIIDSEMDCGDVVRLLAVIDGTEKEIGKAIVMALAGSKLNRQIIPEGWRAVKVTSYTSAALTEACPILAGWTEQAKYRTVKQASGRTIVWLDNRLRTLFQLWRVPQK